MNEQSKINYNIWGFWLTVERLQKSNELGNVVKGEIISVNTSNCISNVFDRVRIKVGEL